MGDYRWDQLTLIREWVMAQSRPKRQAKQPERFDDGASSPSEEDSESPSVEKTDDEYEAPAEKTKKMTKKKKNKTEEKGKEEKGETERKGDESGSDSDGVWIGCLLEHEDVTASKNYTF